MLKIISSKFAKTGIKQVSSSPTLSGRQAARGSCPLYISNGAKRITLASTEALLANFYKYNISYFIIKTIFNANGTRPNLEQLSG